MNYFVGEATNCEILMLRSVFVTSANCSVVLSLHLMFFVTVCVVIYIWFGIFCRIL